MKLAHEFIRKYNELEEWLKKQVQNDQYITFSQMITLVGKKNRAVKSHEHFLKSMGNLRNAIVHDPKYTKRIIATPDPVVTQEFTKICNDVFSPPKALSISSRNISSYPLDTFLSRVLPKMRSNDYSQVVIQNEDGTFGLITREGIARWIEDSMEDDIVSLKDVKLKDIVHLEVTTSWDFINANQTIYDAAALFSQDTRRIQALLITQNARPKENPLGILTFWDISKVFVDE